MKKVKQPSAFQVEFICPKCKRHLAWALPSTVINCPECGKWVNNDNRLIEYEVYLPSDSEQTVLFK